MMKPLTLRKIAEVTGGEYVGPAERADMCITGAVRDNREVQGGSLFFCFAGERTDGHSYAAAAMASGAAACVCERVPEGDGVVYILVSSVREALKKLGAFYRSLFTIPIIGITGSVGKTTAKEMTASVLSQRFNVLRTEGNLNNDIGVPLMLLRLQEEHGAAVIEMGISDFGEMTELAEMARPDICVMTNVGYCHLEALGDLDGVLRAKSEVFRFMRPDTLAVVSGDDKLLRGYDTGTRKVTFGFGEGCDFRAGTVTTDGTKNVSFDISYSGGALHAEIPAYGRQLAFGALAAAAVGAELGLTSEEIVRGLTGYAPVGGRSNVEETGYITLINDCYNANPHSVEEALLSLSRLDGKKVAILGDMFELGHDTDVLHRGIGVIAGTCGIDRLICCGKKAEFIFKGLISTGNDAVESWHFPLKEAMFSVLPSLVHEGDIVLVKASHGMHFEEVADALRELK